MCVVVVGSNCISYHHIVVFRLIHTAVAVAIGIVLDRALVGWYGPSTRITTVRRTILTAGGGGEGGFGGGCGVV